MLSTIQIVLLSIIGVCSLLSIIFMIMFAVEITAEHENDEVAEKNQELSAGDVYVTQNIVVEANETKEASVGEMLANLEEQSKEEVVETSNETAEVEEAKEAETEEPKEAQNEIVEEAIETSTETVEVEESKETETAEVEESKETETAEVVESKETEAEEAKEVQNEVVEEASEEVIETSTETAQVEEVKEVETESVSEESAVADHEPVVSGSLDDLKARLEKITENREKIDKDLSKLQKLILNYDRTKRRMVRNQKMLDRRASELTNLNLVMYSVTDIKNVDEEKKQKQEELTAHIAELKASIQDADEFVTSNKEKNDHNVKMAKFLIQEKSRYNEEIAELEELIKKAEDSTDNA